MVELLRIDSRLPALSAWLTYDNTVTIQEVSIDGAEPISFDAFIAQQGGQ